MGFEPDFRDDDVAILDVTGECDASNLHRFREKVDDIIRKGVRSVVLDLRELEFADSKMLGQLLVVQQKLRADGGDVVLLQPGRFVQHSLEVLGLDDVFTICSSEADALRKLNPRAPGTTGPRRRGEPHS